MRLFHNLIPATVTAAFCIGLLSGCAKAPEKELAAAKAAVKAAEDAEADQYMPNNFQNIQKALTSAETEIAIQNKKFFLARSYETAKQLLKNTTDLASDI
ncbi:MAG: DUF4398 domain-containing protein, partial [Chitinivibrionales bacterium]|nr:DUF4398 domain-containing protein [Chitinivibrionales bacterium]